MLIQDCKFFYLAKREDELHRLSAMHGDLAVENSSGELENSDYNGSPLELQYDS